MASEYQLAVGLRNITYGKDYMAYHRFRVRVCVCSLLSLAVIVLLAASMIVQIANHSLFYPRIYELGEGDNRLAPVSTLFCEGIILGRDKVARRLRIVPSPRLSPFPQRSNISNEVFVSRFKYWYKTLYLLEGSTVVLEATSDSDMKVYIIKGRSKLDEWMARNEDKGLPINDDSKDEENREDTPSRSTRISYSLTIQNTNNYYILFSYSGGSKALAKLSLALTIKRKVYDLQDSVYSCEAEYGKSCAAPLLFNSDEKAVIEVLGSSASNVVNNPITTWKCEPRIWFHLVVFAGSFLVFLVLVIVIYVLIVKSKKRKLDLKLQRRESQRQEHAALSRSGTFRSSTRSNVNNGSIRQSPSRTPSRSSSLRSYGNQTAANGMLSHGEARLPPVVTPMYTGLVGSEDSGHETDDEERRRPTFPTQRQRSAASLTSSSSCDVVRKPSFSTFQGSDSSSEAWGRASLPRDRSYSASESGFHASHTLPRDRTASEPPTNRTSWNFPPPQRPASLPVLAPQTAAVEPIQRSLSAEDQNGGMGNSATMKPESKSKQTEEGKANVKFRSLPSRRREMSWKPRLSMVSEV